MNLSALFIRRPVMTTLVMAGILVFGIMAYQRLPVSDLPNVDFPTINVSANLPGASPETMAAAVATPLEKRFTTIAGIDSMTSVSSVGSTQITIQFALDRDIDAAAQDVQAAIAQALRQLPPEMPTPPSYQKSNPADSPILFIALTSPTLPLSALDEYGQTLIGQRISMVPGVAQVSVYGSQKYAVRIRLDPRRLAAAGIGLEEAALAVQTGNSNIPTGVIQGPDKSFTIEASGQLDSAADYRPLIVTSRGGAPLRLMDLGEVADSVANDRVAAWYVTPERQQRAIMLAVQRQPGTNTVEVAEAVKALLPSIREQLPASVSLNVLIDRSESIRESVHDVQFTFGLTLALVIMVMFLFLRNISATAVPSLALPMSIVATFTAMYALEYSLDNLSLLALTLAVGFVVDDAIVMSENIIRHFEMGKPRLQAALDGSREVGFTIVSMTISLAAVFIPVIFMGGLVGRLFQAFAVTIGVAVLISGFISLTLTPMLASRWLRARAGEQKPSGTSGGQEARGRTAALYGRSLQWVLRHQTATLAGSAIVFIATVALFILMPKGFIPNQDMNQLTAVTEAVEGISYRAMMEHQQTVAELLRRDPNIEAFMSSSGSRGGSRGENTGAMFIRLKPRGQRRLSADELAPALRAKLSQVPGIKVFIQSPPAIAIGGRFSKSLYQFTLQGSDQDLLYQEAARLEARVRGLKGFMDVTSDLQIKNPIVNVEINRDMASLLGINAAQIENTLSLAYGTRQVSTIFAPNNDYAVIMELLPEFQNDPEALNSLYVRAPSGSLAPISALAKLTRGVGPLTVNHSGQLPSVTISFNLEPGVALSQAVSAVEKLARDLPASLSTSFQGTAQAFKSSLSGMGLLLIMSILVIYLVLGILYESFIHPLTILTALPFAGFGALVTLLIFGVELSLYAYVGVIMLVGLVKKNGIMMVDFAVAAQREGQDAESAIYGACLTRFRPIMMTTLTALAAGLPIALGYGAGAEARRPLGLAVVGGLLFSQSLTLYVTPVFYLVMERLRGERKK